MEVRMTMQLAAAGPARFRLTQNAEINVTPFVDVMLVLLIIFMVAIPVATTSVKLDMPRAAASPTPIGLTIVSIRADGALFIGDTPTTLAALPGDVARALGGPNPRAERVYLRADRRVRYETFMEVTNRLKGSGFSQLGLVSEALS
jgi:biopolymer transport protein ExbD